MARAQQAQRRRSDLPGDGTLPGAAAAPPLPLGALGPKHASCACVRALAPPHWRRRRSHFAAASERVAECLPGVSLRKAAVADGPERAVLSGSRKRTPVGKRRPCHPLGRGALRSCSRALLRSAGGGGGWGKGRGARRVPGLRVARGSPHHACAVQACFVDPAFLQRLPAPCPKQPNPSSFSGLRVAMAVALLPPIVRRGGRGSRGSEPAMMPPHTLRALHSLWHQIPGAVLRPGG